MSLVETISITYCSCFFFFFSSRRRHTRFDCDWSSDVCSSDLCLAAPPVLEFDAQGNLLHSWGGPGEGFDWPKTEHGICVDKDDNVWIGANGPADRKSVV